MTRAIICLQLKKWIMLVSDLNRIFLTRVIIGLQLNKMVCRDRRLIYLLSIAIIRIIITINNIIFTSGTARPQNLASGSEDSCFVFSELDIVLGLPVDSNSSVDALRLNSGFGK